MPSVIRLLGATAPALPRLLAGTKYGKPTAPAVIAALLRKLRRVILEYLILTPQ
jgi:hypothetical protein